MICEYCKKTNRDIAKYCKWCGKPLAARDPLQDCVGLDNIKGQLRAIARVWASLRSRGASPDVRPSVNIIISGETGTGKTMLAGLMRDFFYEQKIIVKAKLTMVDAVDYRRFVDRWDENVKKSRGGILFFDNVQKLLPDKYSGQINPLDKLFVEMDRWNDDPIVVIAGLSKGLDEFLAANPAITNRFKYRFNIPAPGYKELCGICRHTLKKKYGIEAFTPEAEAKLTRLFRHLVKTKDETFGYAHVATQTAEDIFTHLISRGTDAVAVTEDDITGDVPAERTLDDILAEMDAFIGMDEVKSAVREMAYSVKSMTERAGRGLAARDMPGMHIVLTGNPGTGKTTIARKLGELLAAVGYIDSGHVVETDRAGMVSPYRGETPKIVDRLCDKAMGGILFIDEAYTLAPQNAAGERDEQGAEALEKLMKRMEDDRGKFVVIAAGYRAQMDNLFRVNPGLRSRFNYFLNIDDYTPGELFLILRSFCRQKNYTLSPAAEETVKKLITETHARRDKDFANGRAMRQLFDNICKRQAQRLEREDMSALTDEQLMTIEAEDVPYETPKTVSADDCLARLNALVGLTAVKKEIRSLTAYLNLQIKRGDTKTFQGKHYIFTGNPGTGKTTVARIMADIFRTLGIVSRGQLVEADRSRLVAGYSGQTAIKTNQLIDTAIGGVLFIDEAYTLSTGDNDTFGAEAVDTLLKRLEDDRGRFVCIVAGYTDRMHDFIASNPGLKSRFTQTIHFDDYSPEELTEIFRRMCEAKRFTYDDETARGVRRMFERIYLRRDKNFGNAREARRLFDETIERQSRRLAAQAGSDSPDGGDIYAITPADLPGAGEEDARPLDEVLAEIDRLVGMDAVKNTIRSIAVQSMFIRQRTASGVGGVRQPAMNFIITGSPGTGKTTVARKMGEVLQSMGVLPSSHVTEATRATLVGRYMGETPKIVNNVCDKALGGVLFIDEICTLCGEDDTYGREAVDTLAKRMEDDKGKFCVVATGYKKETDRFLALNPALASRFTHHIHIDDYDEDELMQIYKRMAEDEQYVLSPQAEGKLLDVIFRTVTGADAPAGNARAMRALLDATVRRLSTRVSQLPPSQVNAETYRLITPDDIPDNTYVTTT